MVAQFIIDSEKLFYVFGKITALKKKNNRLF